MPKFPAGAVVHVRRKQGPNTKGKLEDQIVVEFPSAVAGGEKGRVVLYEIAALVEGREVGKWRLAQELHFHPLGRVPTASRLVIGADEVPSGKVAFRVTPVGFFHKGEPINGML
jgi:hypothetical protein